VIKTTVVIATLFLFLLIFCLGTNENPFLPFFVFFPQFHLIAFTAFLAILVLGRDYVLFTRLAQFLENHRYKILPLFGLLTTIIINIFVFDNIPHVQDGIHYKYMAEVFAHGELTHIMPNHYEFFGYTFFMVDGSRHFSLFMPGFPLFLTPFALIGMTLLANPLLTAVNIVLIGRIAQYLFGARCSTYSMFLFLCSPFMMTVGGTWLAHPFAAMLTLIAVFSLIQFWDKKTIYLPIIAGSAIGWLVLTRPQNALFLSILIFVVGMFNLKRFHFIRTTVCFSAPIVIGIIILFSYNHTLTGNPLTFVQDVYFGISEPVNDCHTIGLDSGCPHCNGESLPPGGMTWGHGINVTQERIVLLVMETFPHPLFFWFIILSLMLTLNSPSESQKKILLVALFLTPVIGYFLFYFHGNVYGPRYLYEGTVFLVVLAASGIDIVFRTLANRSSRIGIAIVVSFILGGLLFEASQTIPRAVSVYKHGFWGVDDRLKKMIQDGEFDNSVFFVSITNENSYGSGLVAMNLWDFEGNDNIFVKDLGDESNSKYMHYMQDREHYRIRYVSWNDQPVHPIQIHPVLPESIVHVEMEDKGLPYLRNDGNPDYCNVYPVRKDIYSYLGFEEMKYIDLSRRRALYCRFVNEQQSYSFGQYFSKSGVYVSTMAAVSGTRFGDLDVFMDDVLVGSFVLENRGFYSRNEYLWEIEVSQGLHTFQIRPSSDSLPERDYFMIDFIRFEESGHGNQ
jgi:hypothetical protein